MATARDAASQGARLITQLLSFSRRQTLISQTTNINELITSIEAVLRRACGETVELRFKLAPHLWQTELDQIHFQSALLNVVVNARDAIATCGKIEIETRNVFLEDTDTTEFSDIAPGHFVRIRVKDNGNGMTPEVLARAIEPFFTTKNIGEGPDLALARHTASCGSHTGTCISRARLDQAP